MNKNGKRMVCESLQRFFAGEEGRHLWACKNSAPGESILGVTRPNGDCFQNLVSNTADVS